MKFVSLERLAHFKDLLTQLINTKAPLESPEFTGSPVTPTPTNDDSSGKQVVNQQYLFTKMNNALTQVDNMLAGYLPLTGGTVTGATIFTDMIYVPYIQNGLGTAEGFSLASASGLRLIKNSRTNYIRPNTEGTSLIFGVRGTGTSTNVYTLNGDGTTDDNDIATKYYVDNEVATTVAYYLPLSGGTLTGNLTVPLIQHTLGGVAYGLSTAGLYFGTTEGTQKSFMIAPNTATGELVVQVVNGSSNHSYRFNPVGVTNPTDVTDKSYVDTQVINASKGRVWEGNCYTLPNVQAKEATSDEGFTLSNGVKVRIYFDGGNTNSAPTLNVNNTGAYDIITSDGANVKSNVIRQGYYTFTYTQTPWGTSTEPYNAWVLDNTQVATQTSYGLVEAKDSPNANWSGAQGYAASPKALQNVQNIAYDAMTWVGVSNEAEDVTNRTADVGTGFVLQNHVRVIILMNSSNDTPLVNLNVNNTGPIPILNLVTGNSIPIGSWKAGEYVELIYDEEYSAGWLMINRGAATATRLGKVMRTDTETALHVSDNSNYAVPTTNSVYEALTLLNSYASGDSTEVVTLSAANWNTSNGYSLQDRYPTNKYNLKISISSTATEAQRQAFNAAGIIGNDTANILLATNGKPTIDIPVKVETYVKNWSDM